MKKDILELAGEHCPIHGEPWETKILDAPNGRAATPPHGDCCISEDMPGCAKSTDYEYV